MSTPKEEQMREEFENKFTASIMCCGGDFCEFYEHKELLKEILGFWLAKLSTSEQALRDRLVEEVGKLEKPYFEDKFDEGYDTAVSDITSLIKTK